MRHPPSLIRVVTSADAAARDRAAIEGGIPGRALMQRAGAATAGEIAHRYRNRLAAGVLVFAGPGNNGGDAWVVARALAASGVGVRVVEPAGATSADAVAERALALPFVLQAAGSPDALASGELLGGEGIVVDGLLGTGAAGAPREPIATAIAGVRAMRERGATIVALDIPSGVDATSGRTHQAARADLTLTYGTLKRGHLLARGVCGRIAVLDIGLGAFVDAGENVPHLVDGRWVAAQLPEFAADAHKGIRKKIAIVGGGTGMSGAAILAARAAWRSGVGMVKLVVADESLSAVREAEPQSLTAAWPTGEEAARREIGTWADVVAIGPGLGGGAATRELVERILRAFDGPVVLDADAINTFSASVNTMAQLLDGRPAVLTPHAAEFGRLAGLAVDDVLKRRFDVGGAVARHTRAVVLLKGQPTVITAPDGRRFVSATGTPLLAAAGSGDLLTGIVATLLAHIGDPISAAACAAYVHGRAAWLVQRGGKNLRGFALDDVLARLPDAWSLSGAPSRYPVLVELPDLNPAR